MHRIAVVLLIAIGLPATAANPQVRIHTTSGETLTRDLPSHAPDRVIVEFREQPLLARAAKGRVRANAASALDSLHDQFANDLERIHHSLRGKVATAGTEDARVEHRYRLAFAGASARAGRDALPAIRALPYVRAVYPDRRVRASLEHSVPHIGAPQAWEQFHVRGAGIRVAVVDSGIDYTHPALGGAFGPGHKVAGGYDFVNEDADPSDDHGHGTHVAGIVAGSAAPVVGVAPEATLLAYKVLDEYGYGLDSWILAAVERLVDPDGNGDPSDRVDVANLSFGRYSANDDPLVAAVERAAAAGVVFCIAAGNAGSPFTVASPAIAPSAITVGASTLEDDPTSFSSNGPALHSWSVKPEVTAPGDAIVSAAPGGGTAEASGTSMAAPHTAGLAALIRQLHPAWTPAEVKSAIVGTARPQWSVIAAGAGRIDAVQALGATLLPSPSTLTFGIATEKTGTWNAMRKFQLTNRGTAARTLTTRAGQPQNGVTVVVSPSRFTLEPGQTQEIRVDLLLRVEDAYPADFQLAVSGHVFIEGSSTSVQVPWLAMFGNFVVAAYGGAGDTYVGLFQNGTLVGEGNGAAAAGSIGNEVDVVAITIPPEGQQGRLIVRERQRLDGPTVLTLSPDEARFDLIMESVAENGEKLSEIGSLRRGGHWWISQLLTLPSRAVLDYYPAGTLRVSAMNATVIATIEQERHVTYVPQPDGRLRYDNGVHVAALRTLHGVQKSEDLSLGAGDWTSGVVAHPCGATICDYRVITSIGARGLLDAPLTTSRGIRSTKVGLASAADGGDLPNVVFTVTETDRPNVSFTRGVSMFSPRIVARDGKLIAQVGPEPWPLDYTPPEGDEELAYGYGPGVIRTAMGIRWKREEFGRPGDEWTVKATPVSSLGEELADDSLRLRVTMFDAAGSRYDGLRIVSDNFRLSEPMREGPHRAEIVQDYRIGATRGTGTLVATLDKATAATAPTFTSLRIEDSAGRVSFRLQQDEQARLFFSGRQTTFFERSNEVHTWIDPAATKAWWRPYPGTGPWQPLPVAFLGDNYDATGSPAGSMFSVDLRPVTSSVRAGVALKLELANEHGTTSWTLEPAFFVSGEKKRRVAR